VLLRVNEQRNILPEIRKRKINWIGRILRRNCLLKQVIEGKIKGQLDVNRYTFGDFSQMSVFALEREGQFVSFGALPANSFFPVWKSCPAQKSLIQIFVKWVTLVLSKTFKLPHQFSSPSPHSMTILCRPFSVRITAAVIAYKKIRPGP
jgi:hypothetical protein